MPGAHYLGGGKCNFKVWAPFLRQVDVVFDGHSLELKRDEHGYWHAHADNAEEGSRYYYKLDGKLLRPDPASNFQPEGVNGPSVIVDHNRFKWNDGNWKGIAQETCIFYELHVGTFTREGTFEAAVKRIQDLKELGITAVELMPVCQFPGNRNWGYDGAYLFAPQASYGGPDGLKTFVNACHRHGLAVFLDVVYNHFGPEGCYLRDFGPYFTNMYNTPWGDAVNFDNKYSNHVRDFFISNALYWLSEYHVDGLRLDALHQLYDRSAKHFLLELSQAIQRFTAENEYKRLLIGECDLNDVHLVSGEDHGGYGLDCLWNDDFHHAMHVLLTGENAGYYEDFGRIDQMAKGMREGYVYSWNYSKFRKRNYGSSSKSIAGKKLVIFSQNHDQIGNRMLGDRLATLLPFEALKLEAAVLMFSPYLPLLFMGQEYGETAPFLYFVSFEDEKLIKAVRQGRKKEFEAFLSEGHMPDPQAEDTFERVKLNWHKRTNSTLYNFYRRLIELRKAMPPLSNLNKNQQQVMVPEGSNVIMTIRRHKQSAVMTLFNFDKQQSTFQADLPSGRWQLFIDSAHEQWDGPGGTLQAESAGGRQTILMPGFSVAAYRLIGEQI